MPIYISKMHILDGDPGLKLQHTLAEQVASESFKQIYNSLDPTNKRVVDSSMEKHTVAWLKAIPTEPKLSIPSDKMVIALRLFLGITLQKDVKECPICRKKIDDFNVHMLICSTKKSLTQHYDAIKHCVKELCNAAELHVDVEASPFWKRDTNGKKDQRRPDLIIHNLTRRGSSLAIDISIANLFSQVGGSNPRPLTAALSREMDKINKYAAD